MSDARAIRHPTAPSAHENRVLTEAVARVASNWKLTNDDLHRILGISATSAHRLRNKGFYLERGGKPFELAQYLLRLFRALDSIMGSDDAASISWLRSRNEDLDARPLDLIGSIRGLMRVADYVDGYRAKV